MAGRSRKAAVRGLEVQARDLPRRKLAQVVDQVQVVKALRRCEPGEARARAWFGSGIGERRVEVRCRPVGRAQAISAAIQYSIYLSPGKIADAQRVTLADYLPHLDRLDASPLRSTGPR